MRRNVKMVLAYRGCSYLGWQETGTGPSIEGELQRALECLLRHPVELQAASRTDAGVHARGQVVNFFPNETISLTALNHLLPPTIRARDVEEVHENFHPTLDAVGKTYIYRLCEQPLPHLRHLAWHRPGLDIAAIREAAKRFVGTHDFHLFCNQRKDLRYTSTIRTITSITVEPWEGGIAIEIIGNNFLYKMVRNLVGALVGSRPVTAPAHGLCLEKVLYSL